MSSMYIRWFMPPVHLLSMGLRGIIAITNYNGDSVSSRNIPLWIFTSAKVFNPTVNSTLLFFMVSSMKFMTSSDILDILRQSIIQFCWRCPSCNGYRRRKWTRRHEFKSWTWLTAFHIALIPLRKVWIQLFSLQLWVNSRADWVLQPWWGS